MVSELNITDECKGNAAEAFAGEGKGVNDENKIVQIPQAKASDAADVSNSAAENGDVGVDTQTAAKASYTGRESGTEQNFRRETSSYREDFRDVPDPDEEERPKRRFWRFRSGNDEESRDKLILSRIKDEELMEYLALEQRRLEFLQQAKESKEKRILNAFQLLITLAAIVALTYLLQDNPTILISILYVAGIVAALNVWRNPRDRGSGR